MERSNPDVRLAILVAYHFDDFLRGLVEVHLEQTRRNTPPGTIIMGAAIRLEPAQQEWLSAQPDVRLLCIESLPQEGRAEHNSALDQLAQIAFEEGASHVATFHQDSFPVHPNWLKTILHDLDDTTVFAAVEPRAYNSCMVWGTNWQARGPKMLPDQRMQDSEVFTRFKMERPDLDPRDGGIGHLLLAKSLGLRWRPLQQTSPQLQDGLVMHLTGATRLVHRNSGKRKDSTFAKVLRNLTGPARAHLPVVWRKRLSKAVGVAALKDWSTPIGQDGTPEEKRAQIAQLVADPDAYIASALANSGDGFVGER